jgi:translation initiation factor 2B subunit (eIF-2B alpha/beta/delta family)
MECIIRADLHGAAHVAIGMVNISEREAVRLVSKYPTLIETYLNTNNYSPNKLRDAVRGSLSDEQVLGLIDACISILEESLESVDNKRDELIQYIRFVSALVDAKFIQWYVKASGGSITGTRITRLAAIINKYRRTLYTDQHARIKAGLQSTDLLIKNNREPRHDGRVFFHHLSI